MKVVDVPELTRFAAEERQETESTATGSVSSKVANNSGEGQSRTAVTSEDIDEDQDEDDDEDDEEE